MGIDSFKSCKLNTKLDIMVYSSNLVQVTAFSSTIFQIYGTPDPG